MDDETLVENLVAIVEGDWLDVLLGLPIGATALIRKFLDDGECVEEDCDCEDEDCPKVSVDGDEVGCECCCNV